MLSFILLLPLCIVSTTYGYDFRVESAGGFYDPIIDQSTGKSIGGSE